MNDQQKKEYILKSWKMSSGERIVKMIQRYWGLDNRSRVEKAMEKQKEIEKAADEAFRDVS